MREVLTIYYLLFLFMIERPFFGLDEVMHALNKHVYVVLLVINIKST